MSFQSRRFPVGRFQNFEAKVWRARQNGDHPAPGKALAATADEKAGDDGVAGPAEDAGDAWGSERPRPRSAHA